jgi:hypothetical protein
MKPMESCPMTRGNSGGAGVDHDDIVLITRSSLFRISGSAARQAGRCRSLLRVGILKSVRGMRLRGRNS